MVNNAGIDIPGPITMIEEEDFDRLIAVNLKAVYFGCKKAIIHMLDHGGGNIINISSLAAVCGTTGLSLYSAAKAGIVGLTRSLAAEYALQRIRVNAICPGWIRTGMSQDYLEGMEEFVVDTTPMGRVGDPADIAPTAVYLASDDSRFMTGQPIVVDGGYSVV
jgi:NAD(P)-dependent dehydrogenase (short-subunit alcohol dehydrogenase family)